LKKELRRIFVFKKYYNNNSSEESPICEIEQFEPQESFCSGSSRMAKAEKCLSNFMYDNQSLKDSKCKKTSSCNDVLDCLGPNVETWILQCPKGFDPKSIMNTELGKLSKAECSANRFGDGVSLACITPEKATEYESVCDNVRILRPVGKIFITENKSLVTPKHSKTSMRAGGSCSDNEIDECSDDGDIQPCPSAASNKVKRKINDQKFTIETTVTVQNCGSDKKKSRKMKMEEEECTSTSSPPAVSMKKKKKCKNDSLGWLD
jgi:hypothetical protein